MKKQLLLILTLSISIAYSQDGNSISNPILIDGTDMATNVLDYNSATVSGLTPACSTNEDVFYKHIVAPGNNKMTVGMISAGTSLFTNVQYQLFKAPNDDMNLLEEMVCDSYPVIIFVGGNFELKISEVNSADTYYLRVYKTNGLGGALTNLLNNTAVTMRSEFDSTLSTISTDLKDIKYTIDSENIKFINQNEDLHYKIYGMDGKLIETNKRTTKVESVDISALSNGIYILTLSNNNANESFKFIKH